MAHSPVIREIQESDYAAWLPLWLAYNAFYGREGATALDPAITRATWSRFFDPAEPVHAFVAESAGQLVGITHYLYHRSTTRLEPTCYLQDLFTAPESRGQGVGRALIQAVYGAAKAQGVRRVYWQTHHTNTAARTLYDQVAKHSGFLIYAQDV